jgi:hypothetical protein
MQHNSAIPKSQNESSHQQLRKKRKINNIFDRALYKIVENHPQFEHLSEEEIEELKKDIFHGRKQKDQFIFDEENYWST